MYVIKTEQILSLKNYEDNGELTEKRNMAQNRQKYTQIIQTKLIQNQQI